MMDIQYRLAWRNCEQGRSGAGKPQTHAVVEAAVQKARASGANVEVWTERSCDGGESWHSANLPHPGLIEELGAPSNLGWD